MPTTRSPLDRRWTWLIRLFTWYARRYLRRHFHGLRLARDGARPSLPEGPVVVVLNHPSWWDPLVALVLSHRIGRQVMTAPIDARALRGYRFFERLGFFGIEPGTSQGWHTLLRVAGEVLARPDGALWITPQGEFTDARTPIELRGGVGAVVRHMQRGSVLPLALEYTFWDERLPEALARFGPAVVVADGRARSAEEWTQAIAAAMQANQLALAELSQARDPARFEQVLLGQAGVTRAYDLWRRLRAWMGRGPAATEHRALLEEGSR